VEQRDQLAPDERGGVDVLGAATQWAGIASEIAGQRAEPATSEVRKEALGDVVRADEIERERLIAGQGLEERPLESREVRDRRRRLLRQLPRPIPERPPRLGLIGPL